MGSNTNGCQFFLTCNKCEWLDKKHVVFGKVIDKNSLNLIKTIESQPTGANNRPKAPIIISECGEY